MRYFFIASILLLILVACKNKKGETAVAPDIYYTCSMDPQVKENKPGKCPICKMELTPVRKNSQQSTDEIELSAQQVQLGDIQVDTIGKIFNGDQVILNATVGFDQLKANTISARLLGRIDKLYFKNVGEYVAKGAKIYDLYSEELNNAKQEYLLVLEKQRTLGNSVINFTQLVQAAKNKLLLWGMTEARIEELEKNKIASPLTSFYSNIEGYIISLDNKEGDYVTEGGTVLRLADLSTLWVEAQVYSSQLATLDRNQQAIIQFPDIPGKEVKGKIEFVNPEINPDTRINLIRISIQNTGHQLKPGMSAYVTLKNPRHNTLSLPIDAVIRDNRGASVWVQAGANKFKYKMVEAGLEGDGQIEIKTGLKAGELVVVSGAYLLNSEYIFKNGANPMEGMDMKNKKL